MSDEDTATPVPQPTSAPESAFTPPPPPSPGLHRRRRSWLGILPAILAFAAGAVLAIWALPYVTRLWTGQAPPAALPAPVSGQHAPALSSRPIDAATQDMLSMRISELEERLTRITVEAQAASGNAARAEGLLVAVAARRALDAGAPLGYVEGQLRLRFGQAQPRAVATIINAAREPVTLADLESELDDLGPRLIGNSPSANWWTAVQRELHQLVIIRKSTTPSPLPDRAYRRAQQLLVSGRVDAAMSEVEHLPGRESADRWMQMARRYREARRALELIETAAILEPRQIRAGDGTTVTQPSPLAP